MKLHSLGRRTDLIFSRFAGEVHDRGDYIVIKTPSNPGYHWGNYLIFSARPKTGDLKRWSEVFRSEFSFYDCIRHMVFTWDSAEAPEESARLEFEQAGFQLDRGIVLTASEVVRPPRWNDEIIVRPLVSESDWQAATHEQVLCRDESFAEASYWEFKRRQMAMYHEMAQKKRGHWFGAFLGDMLVGDLGLYFEGDFARFQNVVTHPEFRRRGVCGTLVYQSAVQAMENFGIQTLVMEADASYHAARIYESVGFKPTEENFSLSWRADKTAGEAAGESRPGEKQ